MATTLETRICEVVESLPNIECVCGFSHPHVRSRLEKLMGSNIVRLTDRVYMKELQERIHEDHLEMQKKRIAQREAEEIEREKKLVLQGKMPATKEIMEHPMFKVSQMTKKIIEAKRSKMKPVSSAVSSFCYGEEQDNEDAKDAEAVLDITAGKCTTDEKEEEKKKECDPENDEGYIFSPEEFERLKEYESPLVKQLRELKTVDEMYALADKIILPLQTLKRGQHCGKAK